MTSNTISLKGEFIQLGDHLIRISEITAISPDYKGGTYDPPEVKVHTQSSGKFYLYCNSKQELEETLTKITELITGVTCFLDEQDEQPSWFDATHWMPLPEAPKED